MRTRADTHAHNKWVYNKWVISGVLSLHSEALAIVF